MNCAPGAATQQRLPAPALMGSCDLRQTGRRGNRAKKSGPGAARTRVWATPSNRLAVDPLGGHVVVVVEPVLVPHHLTVQLVHQLVDGRIEVLMGVLHEDVLA